MKAIEITLVIALVAFAFGAGYFIERAFSASPTGFAVQNSEEEHFYSRTFALCTTSKKCMDVHVVCNGTRVMNMSGVTEIVDHGEEGEDWKDPRGGNPSILCPYE